MNSHYSHSETEQVRVVLSTEAATGSTAGVYHLLADGEVRSLCGAVKPDSPFGSNPCTVLGRVKAERRGYDACERCLRVAADGDAADLRADEG